MTFQTRARVGPSKIPGAGAGLIAHEKLWGGEDAMIISDPLLAVPTSDHFKDTCAHCFAWIPEGDAVVAALYPTKMILKQCNGCKLVHYCSKPCQVKSWKKGHKHECKLFGHLNAEAKILPTAVRAALQLIWNEATSPSQEYANFEKMSCHIDQIEAAGGKGWDDAKVFLTGVKIFATTRVPIEEPAVRGIVGRFLTNSHSLVTPTMDAVGLCMEPVASVMNHSCKPNAYVIFNGRTCHVRTLVPIEKGEEITICYIDQSQPTALRREELKTRYFFDCNCPKCLAPEPALTGYQQSWANDVRAVMAELPKAPSAEVQLTALQDCERVMRKLEGGFPFGVQPAAELNNTMYQVSLELGRMPEAMTYLLQCMENHDRIMYERTHPLRVVRAWTYALLVLGHTKTPDGKIPMDDLVRNIFAERAWNWVQEVRLVAEKSHGEGSLFEKWVVRRSEEIRIGLGKPDMGLPEPRYA